MVFLLFIILKYRKYFNICYLNLHVKSDGLPIISQIRNSINILIFSYIS